jgi:GTP-binding protein
LRPDFIPLKTKIPAIPALLRAPEFVISAHRPSQWPPDEGAEVVFAGRSNVGKSSAINAIVQRKGLARTSKTPGRTQQIIFFALAPQRHLVDLPGYGYAKVSADLKRHWEQTIMQYLAERQALRGVVLVMDIRHPLTPLDEQMLGWCGEAGLPVHILLTKADKLKRAAANQVLQRVSKAFPSDAPISVQLFSAQDQTGLEEARNQVVFWLQDE